MQAVLFALLSERSVVFARATALRIPQPGDLSPFLTCLCSPQRQHVTRLTLEYFTNSFQGIERNALGLVLL